LGQLRAQLLNDLVHGLLAGRLVAQLHEERADVGARRLPAAGADAGHERLDLGILCNDLRQGLLVLRHLGKGSALRGLGLHEDAPLVVGRQEALGILWNITTVAHMTAADITMVRGLVLSTPRRIQA